MAVATSTALAIGSIAASSAGMAGSFIQAGNQNREMKKAQAGADKALAEAKLELERNFFKGLSIPKEAYRLMREQISSTAAQATEAATESERGIGAAAGRIYAGQQQMQGEQRAAMEKQMFELDKLVASQDQENAQMRASLDLETAKGFEKAAADAAMAKNAAITSGIQSAGAAANTALSTFLPLYPAGKTPAASKGGPVYTAPAGVGGVPTTVAVPRGISGALGSVPTMPSMAGITGPTISGMPFGTYKNPLAYDNILRGVSTAGTLGQQQQQYQDQGLESFMNYLNSGFTRR